MIYLTGLPLLKRVSCVTSILAGLMLMKSKWASIIDLEFGVRKMLILIISCPTPTIDSDEPNHHGLHGSTQVAWPVTFTRKSSNGKILSILGLLNGFSDLTQGPHYSYKIMHTFHPWQELAESSDWFKSMKFIYMMLNDFISSDMLCTGTDQHGITSSKVKFHFFAQNSIKKFFESFWIFLSIIYNKS